MYEAPCLRAMHRLMAVQHVKKREVTSFDEITLVFGVGHLGMMRGPKLKL